MRLSNAATCESALLVCSRAYKALPLEMQFKEINTVAATALYNVANICNLTEYSKRIEVSFNAIRLLNNLWLTKSDEILMDQVKDSHRPTAKVLKISIKERITISKNDAKKKRKSNKSSSTAAERPSNEPVLPLNSINTPPNPTDT
jgi:hypothetical protein